TQLYTLSLHDALPISMQNAPYFGHIASGTNVEPASTPAHMLMWQRNGWMLMLHGAAFLEGNFQGGPRGDHAFDSPNWLMLMEHRSEEHTSELQSRGHL